jgi:hypothetical protein
MEEMNCHDFKDWLVSRDIQKNGLEEKAREHVMFCEECKKIAAIDSLIEDRIRICLCRVDPPIEFSAILEMDLRSAVREKNATLFSWKKLVPALAIAAVLLAIVFNPLSGRIKSLDQFSSLALANHLDPDLKPVFRAGDIPDASGWFSDKLGFPVFLPKYNIQGSTFLGGRECLLDKKKAAYLFYEIRGKRVSLFIIHARDLSIPLKGERVYNVSDKEHDVKVWKEGDLVFALVR